MKLDLEGIYIYISHKYRRQPTMQTVGIIKQIYFNIFYNSSQITAFSFYTNTWSMTELHLTEQVGLLPGTEAF